MGQYYRAVLLSAETNEIVAWFNPRAYSEGAKMMEHAYVGTNTITAVLVYLSEHPNTRLRLVWAGDYADAEEGHEENLYYLCYTEPDKNVSDIIQDNHSMREVLNTETTWIVNETQKLYMKTPIPTFTSAYENGVHPLPLLTWESTQFGGGDYRGGTNEAAIGSWARDIISIAYEHPSEGKEVHYEFIEN